MKRIENKPRRCCDVCLKAVVQLAMALVEEKFPKPVRLTEVVLMMDEGRLRYSDGGAAAKQALAWFPDADLHSAALRKVISVRPYFSSRKGIPQGFSFRFISAYKGVLGSS